jgi:DNA-binding NarL/FixJ family response regulator
VAQTPVTVLIADDDELFVSALEAILASDERIHVVGKAADGAVAVRLAGELEPRVVIMDLSMPVLDGFDATRQIRVALPETSVLILTGSADPADIARAKEIGASGYVTKDRIASELVPAILAAAESGRLS